MKLFNLKQLDIDNNIHCLHLNSQWIKDFLKPILMTGICKVGFFIREVQATESITLKNKLLMYKTEEVQEVIL